MASAFLVPDRTNLPEADFGPTLLSQRASVRVARDPGVSEVDSHNPTYQDLAAGPFISTQRGRLESQHVVR